jgi:hypothetical protein
MRGLWTSLLLVVLGTIAACSSNAAATAKCNESKSSGECQTCCHANGALGQSWSGAGTCKCLN